MKRSICTSRLMFECMLDIYTAAVGLLKYLSIRDNQSETTAAPSSGLFSLWDLCYLWVTRRSWLLECKVDLLSSSFIISLTPNKICLSTSLSSSIAFTARTKYFLNFLKLWYFFFSFSCALLLPKCSSLSSYLETPR